MKHQYKELFTKDQIDSLKAIIDNEKNTKELFVWDENNSPKISKEDNQKIVQNISLGKITISLNGLIPEDIANRLNEIAMQYDPSAKFANATYTEYALRYGKPKLIEHVDKVSHFLLIDYQLEANTSWLLYIENQDFDLKNNEAAIFYPGEMLHGRREKDFNDSEYIKMIFFDMERGKNA